jgi:hypothetical protein
VKTTEVEFVETVKTSQVAAVAPVVFAAAPTTTAPSTLFLMAGDTVLASTGASNVDGMIAVGSVLIAGGVLVLFVSLFRRRKVTGSHN